MPEKEAYYFLFQICVFLPFWFLGPDPFKWVRETGAGKLQYNTFTCFPSRARLSALRPIVTQFS